MSAATTAATAVAAADGPGNILRQTTDLSRLVTVSHKWKGRGSPACSRRSPPGRRWVCAHVCASTASLGTSPPRHRHRCGNAVTVITAPSVRPISASCHRSGCSGVSTPRFRHRRHCAVVASQSFRLSALGDGIVDSPSLLPAAEKPVPPLSRASVAAAADHMRQPALSWVAPQDGYCPSLSLSCAPMAPGYRWRRCGCRGRWDGETWNGA